MNRVLIGAAVAPFALAASVQIATPRPAIT